MESVAQNLQLRCSGAGCASAAFCINAAGACGQPGDCQSTRMSPGHSPHLLLSNPGFWFCFFFPHRELYDGLYRKAGKYL